MYCVQHPETALITNNDSVGAKGLSPLQGRYPAGMHEFVWNADGVASGVYLVRLELQSAGTLQHREAGKVVLVK